MIDESITAELLQAEPKVTSVFTRKIVQKLPLTLVFAYLAHLEDTK